MAVGLQSLLYFAPPVRFTLDLHTTQAVEAVCLHGTGEVSRWGDDDIPPNLALRSEQLEQLFSMRGLHHRLRTKNIYVSHTV